MATPPRLQVGGNLKLGDLYISRTEDESVYELLAAHEFVNILTSRQMGKSSLMVRLHHRLMAERGARVASVDMAGDLGTPPDRDLWYRGLLGKIADELGLDHDVDAWWQAAGRGTPNQRLLQFFTDVVCVEIDAPVVIFLDEIDATLKLDYSDDLFTAIRSLYNKRAEQPALERLTFCLIGVATTRELIKERRTTPYNVGQTVELRDFDPEVDDLLVLRDSLAAGGGDGDGAALLAAILRWTGGHPFLTVALTALALAKKAATAAEIDGLVADGGFANGDVVRGHLASISRFLETRLENEATTFQLYNAVLRGRRVPDRSSAAHLELRLSGLVRRGADDHLTVRNPIYRQRFGLAWLRQTRPLITQRRLVRIVIALSIVVLVGAAFAVVVYLRARDREARRQERMQAFDAMLGRLRDAPDEVVASSARDQICDALRNGRLPASAVARAGDAWRDYWALQAASFERAAATPRDQGAELLFAAMGAVKRGALSPALRSAYAQSSSRALVATLRGHVDAVNRIRFLDAQRLASISKDETLRVFDLDGRLIATSPPIKDLAPALAVCPRGECILTAFAPGTVERWTPGLSRDKPVVISSAVGDQIYALAVDDRASFAAGSKRGEVTVAEMGQGLAAGDEPRSVLHLEAAGRLLPIHAVQYIQRSVLDSEPLRVVTGAFDGVRVIDLDSNKVRKLPGITEPVFDVFATMSGALIGVALSSRVLLVDPARPDAPTVLSGGDRHLSVDLSADGSQVLSAVRRGSEGHVMVWRVADGEVVFDQATPLVRDARFAPGQEGLIASAHDDGTIRVWQLGTDAELTDAHDTWLRMQRKLGLTLDARGEIVPLGADGPRPTTGYTANLCAPVVSSPP